jgi:hypothetical protein
MMSTVTLQNVEVLTLARVKDNSCVKKGTVTSDKIHSLSPTTTTEKRYNSGDY